MPRSPLQIDILTHDLTENNFGRVVLLADIASRIGEVKIIGLTRPNKSIWRPLSNTRHSIVEIERPKGNRLETLETICRHCTGDVVIACKPYFYALGAGLYVKWKKRKPLIIDIDDWEIGLLKDARKQSGIARWPHYGARLAATWLFGRLSVFGDQVLVSNSFLKDRYGGELFPHYRDTGHLVPREPDLKLKQRWRIPPNRKIILFFGTPKSHKGLEILEQSFKDSPTTKNVILVIVGLDSMDARVADREQNEKHKEKGIYYFGEQPFENIPAIVSIADVVAVPQATGEAARGQLPAKLIDAMCMGRPTVSTSVSDIPDILAGDCGMIAAAGDGHDLFSKIQRLIDNPRLGEQMGANARKKCETLYSYDSGEKKLREVLHAINIGSKPNKATGTV